MAQANNTGYTTNTNAAPSPSDQAKSITSEEEGQNNVSNNADIPPVAQEASNKPPSQPQKASPERLAEDLGTGRKYGAVMYVQNRYAGKITAKTSNFYLQQMALGLRERSQVLETFGVANVSFFGQSAKVYNFGGTALD